MMGASHAGTAAAFGPDNGKCSAAAKNVFGIIDTPSNIDAIAINQEKEKKNLDFNNI